MSILRSTQSFTRQGMEQADTTWKLALLRAGDGNRQHSDLNMHQNLISMYMYIYIKF